MVNGEPVEQRQCYPIGGGGELTEHICLAVVDERGVLGMAGAGGWVSTPMR